MDRIGWVVRRGGFASSVFASPNDSIVVHSDAVIVAKPRRVDAEFSWVGRGAEQALGSIVRVTDSNGDGTWGNGNDVNQTVAENIYNADWTHQINQFAIHDDSLYVGIGTMTNNGGIINSIGDSRNPGESAHTGAVVFIEDLTVHSNDTASTNAAWFDFPAAENLTIVNPARVNYGNEPSRIVAAFVRFVKEP